MGHEQFIWRGTVNSRFLRLTVMKGVIHSGIQVFTFLVRNFLTYNYGAKRWQMSI
uniref:Uncharacterized protein n=1 Tax=Manihot esculenta TaxID=3983 RepID=A0A2C9WMG0_MANES